MELTCQKSTLVIDGELPNKLPNSETEGQKVGAVSH